MTRPRRPANAAVTRIAAALAALTLAATPLRAAPATPAPGAQPALPPLSQQFSDDPHIGEAPRLPAARVAALLADHDDRFEGNPRGTIPIIEFFDPRCPFCKRMQPRLQALLRADHRLILVLKDWPILGPVSVQGARIEIAAGYQNRYAAVHDAIMALREPVTVATLRAAAATAGADMPRLDHDLATHARQIDAILARNAAEARNIGLNGTPSFVVGPQVMPGAVSSADLRDEIARAAR